MGCGESEEEHEINVQEQKGEQEGSDAGDDSKAEEKKTKPAEKKPDNKPYEAMKGTANPAAWTAFSTYALHEQPKGAPKSTNQATKDVIDIKKDKFRGQTNAKNLPDGFGVIVR